MKAAFRRTLLALQFLCLIAAAGTAAQEPSAALEEVVVTAQKRTESLQDVPVSVSALSSSEVEGLRLRQASDIAAVIPNLQATNTIGDGVPIFSLRGISMSDFSLNQLSPVAVYVDEVYKGNPALQGVQMYDLERVEVLRGPQGTLYGKNTTGGAVNFITRKPSMETGGHISVAAGNFSRREVDAAFETALVEDVLGLRIAGTWSEADGWFENRQAGVDDGNAVDQYGVRATFLWQPTDAVEITLRAATSREDAVNYGIQPFNISPEGVGAGLYGLYSLLGASSQTDYTRDGIDFFEFDSDQDERREAENDSFALTIKWDLSDTLTLTSITSWDEGELLNPEDADGSPLIVVRPSYFGDAEQFAQDLRLTSDTGTRFDFIAGVYLSDEEVFNTTTIGFWQDLDLNADGVLDFADCLDPLFTSLGLGPATPAGAVVEGILNGFGTSLADFVPAGCQLQNEFQQDRSSLAGYFDARLDLSDTTSIRFGLRHTTDETELRGFSARVLGNDSIPLLNTIPGDLVDPFAVVPDDSFEDQEWSGKIGLDFTLESGTLLYGLYSRGYRSGAYNAQALLDPAELTRVEPEIVNSFEVGFKSELLDGRMRLNGAAFHYDYENQQFLNVDTTTLAQTLINIDESTVTGLELETTVLVTDALTMRAGLGIIDSEVDKGVLSGVDLAGNELLLAPGINFNVSADWTVFDHSLGSLSVLADGSYLDDHYFEIFNVDRLKQEAYWLWNGRLQFDSAEGTWAVAAWGKNLFDEEYRTSAIDLSDFGYDYSHIGAPRTYGVEFMYRF